MFKYVTRHNLPAMLGATIEYYDLSLYGYLAPVMVSVFFPNFEKNIAYFVYFFVEFLSVLAQLLGANYFGKIGDRLGRKPAMYKSMLGVSSITFLVCIVPTYEMLGIFATIMFLSLRILQRFFLGGEYNGGAIYCLEHENNKKNHLAISAIYCAFTVAGILMASLVALMCNYLGSEYFRLAYGLSAIFSIVIFKLRNRIKELPRFLKFQKQKYKQNNLPFKPIYQVIICSLFFGITYGLSTKIFNALLPMVSNISNKEIMTINCVMLVFYLVFLSGIALISQKFSARKIMSAALISTLVLAYPILLMLKTANLKYVFIGKLLFTLLTAAFVGPFHSFSQNISDEGTRYRNVSVSYSIGKALSTLLLSMIFIAYKKYQDILLLAIFLIVISIITFWFMNGQIFQKKYKAVS